MRPKAKTKLQRQVQLQQSAGVAMAQAVIGEMGPSPPQRSTTYREHVRRIDTNLISESDTQTALTKCSKYQSAESSAFSNAPNAPRCNSAQLQNKFPGRRTVCFSGRHPCAKRVSATVRLIALVMRKPRTEGTDMEEKAASAERGQPRDHEARARFEARLRDDFKIDTTFVPVRVVARVLGFAPSTLHEYVREGRFFMPFTRLTRIPMVAVDDLVEWYCAGTYAITGAASKIPQARAQRRRRRARMRPS